MTRQFRIWLFMDQSFCSVEKRRDRKPNCLTFILVFLKPHCLGGFGFPTESK